MTGDPYFVTVRGEAQLVVGFDGVVALVDRSNDLARTFAGEQEPTPVPVIDARSRVEQIGAITIDTAGRTVALLKRSAEAPPDALILSTDMGRTWLSEPGGGGGEGGGE